MQYACVFGQRLVQLAFQNKVYVIIFDVHVC